MDNNLRQLIIISNKSIWNEHNYRNIAQKGLYEVYFIVLHNEKRKESYWIRYTLLCNKKSKNEFLNLNNSASGGGVLWFGCFHKFNSQGTFMVKKHFQLSEVKGSYTKDDDYIFISIANAFLSLNKATGEFTTKSDKHFSWEITFSNVQQPYNIVPEIAKTLKISNTMNKATFPYCEISGTIEIDGEAIEIEKNQGIQYHTYADSYSLPWEWFSCYTIPEWPRGYIDFSYKVNKGILEINDGKASLTVWNKNFLKKLLTSKKLKRDHSITSLLFQIENKGIIISGTIQVSKEDLLGVEYKGPTGETFYCYNSEIADGSFKIVKQVKANKMQETIEFYIQGTIAFETTYKKPIDGIKFLPWDQEELI